MNRNSKALVLFGKSNSGKTETLKILERLLYHKDNKIEAEPPIAIGKDRIYNLNYRGKRLGIVTRGDAKEFMEEDFPKCPDKEIYICAARTKGGTIEFIEDNFKPENTYWLGKSSFFRWDEEKKGLKIQECENIRETINQEQAKWLLELLDKIIDNQAQNKQIIKDI